MADRWETLNLQTLVPAFVPAAADAASGVVGSVGSVLQVAVTLMNTARSFIIDVTDPMAAVANALIKEIEGELSDFYNAGGQVTYVVPKRLADRRGLNSTLRLIINSMYDLRDPNRPQYAEQSTVGAIVVAIGGADVAQLLPTAGILGTLFNVRELQEFAQLNNHNYVPQRLPFPNGGGSVTGIPKGKDPRGFFDDFSRAESADRFARLRITFQSGRNKGRTTVIRAFAPGSRTFEIQPLPYALATGDLYQILYPPGGQYPDWSTRRAVDMIPPLGEIFTALTALTRMLSAGVAASQAAGAFVTALQRKLTNLQNVVAMIQQRIDTIEQALQASGIAVLHLEPQPGGNDKLAQRLLKAANAPPWREGTDYTAAVVIVSANPAYDIITRLL
jgi:hypothetical protein